MMLNTSISLSESLSKLVMVLNKRPDLTSMLKLASGDEERKSIVENTADTIQKIFTTCLTDRTSTRWSKPEGKKVGVYIFANLVLKLLFTVGCLLLLRNDKSVGHQTANKKDNAV